MCRAARSRSPRAPADCGAAARGARARAEWSADKGWSATAQDAVQDAFIELSLGRGTVRHAAFARRSTRCPRARSASPTTARRRRARRTGCRRCASSTRALRGARRRGALACADARTQRRACRKAAAAAGGGAPGSPGGEQVDSALLRGARRGRGTRRAVAAVIALLRDAAGAELPRARAEQLLALPASGASRRRRRRRSRSSCVVAALSGRRCSEHRAAARGGGVAGGRAKGTRWAPPTRRRLAPASPDA